MIAKDLGFGQFFQREFQSETFMRLKPVNFLLNSSLICDCINLGKVLVVNLETGNCYFIKGDETVIPAKLRVTTTSK
jgi:hypothetical protein